MFFCSSPTATWPQFGEMLSWQFLSATKRGLNDAQLEMIAHKLFGKFCFSFPLQWLIFGCQYYQTKTFHLSFTFNKYKQMWKEPLTSSSVNEMDNVFYIFCLARKKSKLRQLQSVLVEILQGKNIFFEEK